MLSDEQVSKELMDRNWSYSYFEDLGKIDAALKSLAIPADHLLKLVNATGELKDSNFRAAAFAMLELKKKAGKNAKEAEIYINQLGSQITAKESQYSDWSARIEKLKAETEDWKRKCSEEKVTFENELTRHTQILREAEEKFNQEQERRKRVLKDDAEKLNQELRRNNEVRENIEEAISIKVELKKVGLDLATFKSLIAETNQKGRIGPRTAKKIRKVIKEFGSLGKAIEARKNDEEARGRNILNLVIEEKGKRDTLRGLDEQIAARRQAIEEQDKKIQAKVKEIEACLQRVEQLGWQYQFFELLINMLSTSPSANVSMAALTVKLQEFAKRAWVYSTGQTAAQCRAAFVTFVLGEYLHSVHCSYCGASFIVNKAYNSKNQYQTSYYCPICNFASNTKPDETFLNLMASPELETKFRYVRNVLDLTGKTGVKVMGSWLNLVYSLPEEVHAAMVEGRKIELKVADGTDKK